MGNKQKNQAGFSALEVLLVLVVVALICLGGWLVFKNHNKMAESRTTASVKTTPEKTSISPTPALPDSAITSGPGADWNTYTNNKVGFTIQIPKQYLSSNGAPCTQVTYVFDNYGNKVASTAHYIPAQGVVPATVVEDGNNFYVVEQYTYQPTNKTTDSSGHELAASCPKMTTTGSVIGGYKQTNPLYELNPLPFSVAAAQSQQDVLNWAQHFFNDKTITISSVRDNAGGWQDITLDCSSSNPCSEFNYKFYLRYYKNKNKVAYMAQGQSGHLQTPDGKSFYDQQVWDSFRLK